MDSLSPELWVSIFLCQFGRYMGQVSFASVYVIQEQCKGPIYITKGYSLTAQ